jgi:hypothetical protein
VSIAEPTPTAAAPIKIRLAPLPPTKPFAPPQGVKFGHPKKVTAPPPAPNQKPPHDSQASGEESQTSPPAKKKKPVVTGPVAGSVFPTGPVFFSDLEENDPEDPEEEDYDTFVRRITRITKRKRKAVVLESDNEDEFEDDEEFEDPDDAEDNEEDDVGQHYVKEEGSRIRYIPQQGNRRHNPPCDNCIRKTKACIVQGSNKARGACYECGRLKQKCIFSVSKSILIVLPFFSKSSRCELRVRSQAVRSVPLRHRNPFQNATKNPRPRHDLIPLSIELKVGLRF